VRTRNQQSRLCGLVLLFAIACSPLRPTTFAQHESWTIGGRPLNVTFSLRHASSEHAQRIVETTKQSLEEFTEWFGPYPANQLTIADAAWSDRTMVALNPGVVTVRSRWLQPARDGALERSLIAAIARQYWLARTTDAETAWFDEAAALYSAARAMNALGVGAGADVRHYVTLRYFGGFVPYSVRSLPLARPPNDPRPVVQDFPELQATSGRADRAARALQSLERYAGWSAVQQALVAFRQRIKPRGAGAATFAAILSEQRGQDLRWYFADTHLASTLDYGIESFTSEQVSAASGFESHVRCRRFGDGVFAGRALLVEVEFEDGTKVAEWWDGRESRLDLEYASKARAVRAIVDPNRVLLLDADRTNNVRLLQPRLPQFGARAVLNWLLWLQDLMLTYTSVA